MKIIVVVIMILFILIGGIWGMYYYTTLLYEDLNTTFNDLYEQVDQENWKASRQLTEKLESQWDEAEQFWATFMDHQEIDMVDESVNRIISLCKIENKSDLQVEINLAKRYLYRIQEKESPDIKNVL